MLDNHLEYLQFSERHCSVLRRRILILLLSFFRPIYHSASEPMLSRPDTDPQQNELDLVHCSLSPVFDFLSDLRECLNVLRHVTCCVYYFEANVSVYQ